MYPNITKPELRRHIESIEHPATDTVTKQISTWLLTELNNAYGEIEKLRDKNEVLADIVAGYFMAREED